MAKKSFLDSIEVPAPCEKSWDEMVGGDEVRFCSGCQKNVHNISAMPRPKARRLVAENAGKICIRYTRLPNGKVLTDENRLHQISRCTSAVAAGVIAATLTLSAMTYAQGESKVTIVKPNSITVTQVAKKPNSQAAITVIVTDQNGAAISFSKIILRDIIRNTVIEVLVNDKGFYQSAELLPSTYEIEISADGFKPFIEHNLNFASDKNVEIKISLEAIIINGAILSGGEPEIIGTTDSEVSTTISNRSLESLPAQKNFSVLGLVAGNSKITSISFIIYDQMGAIIPDIQITLTNLKTNQIFSIPANNDGIATFASISDGKYLVAAKSSIGGFSEYRQTIEVNKQTKPLIKIILKVKADFVMGDFTVTEPVVSPKISESSSNKRRSKNASDTSQISFTISDPVDALIAGAEVQLTNQKTKTEYNAITDENGIARFGLISHGRYDLLVTSSIGFNDYRQIVQIKDPIEPNIKITLNVETFTGIVVADWSEVPLFQAITQKDNKTVKQLINSGFNVNTKDSRNETALHVAVEHNNLEIVRLLLEKGAKVNAKNKDNRSPLSMLIENSDKEDTTNLEILRLLIAKGADVNAQNEDKKTLLMSACEDENLEVVKILLEAKADPNFKDEDGETALQKTDSDEIKRLLLSYGARQN